jgi:molybdopterin synthase catalytic subunit
MKIRLFATLKERARQPEITVTIPETAITVRVMRGLIALQHPALAELVDTAVIAINAEFAFDDDEIKASDEVAVFPPVSGGAPDREHWPTRALITHEKIDLDEMQRFVTTDFDGSAVLFIGTVRKITGDQVTTQLEYEAYERMALDKMQQVARELRQQFPDVHGVYLVQRVGQMQAGEPAVAVACSASHRGAGAFEAARFGIDRIKQIVPVWKKEIGPDGQEWVEGDYVPKRGD